MQHVPASRDGKQRQPFGFAQDRQAAELHMRALFFAALAVALALFFCFIFEGIPVGLGITLIVSGLVLRRAGHWWRREPAQALAPAGA